MKPATTRRLAALDPSVTRIDNRCYDQFADRWWDRSGPVAGLHDMNPTRVDYFERVLACELGPAAKGSLRLIDVGCGGGILTEEMARRGHAIVGFDVSESSLQAGRRHAAASGVQVEYRAGSAYELPLSSDSVDVVIISDVLEHLHDLPRAIRELCRVLRPGGVLAFDTINRTIKSWVLMILLAQDIFKLVHPNTHNWRMFIRPGELTAALTQAGLRLGELKGLVPANPISRVLLDALKGNRIGAFTVNDDLTVSYLGYALKSQVAV